MLPGPNPADPQVAQHLAASPVLQVVTDAAGRSAQRMRDLSAPLSDPEIGELEETLARLRAAESVGEGHDEKRAEVIAATESALEKLRARDVA